MEREQLKIILNDIINKYLAKQIDVDEVQNHLMEEINPDDIYEIEDDMMVTDCYFALKHLKEDRFETSNEEIKYFGECFSGKRDYNLEEKNKMILKSAGE